MILVGCLTSELDDRVWLRRHLSVEDCKLQVASCRLHHSDNAKPAPARIADRIFFSPRFRWPLSNLRALLRDHQTVQNTEKRLCARGKWTPRKRTHTRVSNVLNASLQLHTRTQNGKCCTGGWQQRAAVFLETAAFLSPLFLALSLSVSQSSGSPFLSLRILSNLISKLLANSYRLLYNILSSQAHEHSHTQTRLPFKKDNHSFIIRGA